MHDGGVRARESEADALLVQDVVGGSQSALAELYDRHATMVYRVAIAVDRDRGAAEEVVQETFLTLWNKAERFDQSRGSLAGWLASIARNQSIDRLRAAGRSRITSFSALTAGLDEEESAVEWLVASGDLVAAGTPEAAPERALEEWESRAYLASTINGLTPVERQAILLAYRDGLTQPEIAERLGWPLGTVKTRSRRALRRLREAIDTGPGSDQAPVNARSAMPCAGP
ncbi:MAG TPA: sigma-70 family RNA polymerase sigma factor [Candidatus Bathyarchaeia archaeon]|nr:sigma-70 family RNA polymerase sigma factor [Candidatus Bathyarchaeia archaeon]